MDSLSQPSTLLILTSREEEAEGIVNSLRNGGLAVQSIFTSEPERLGNLVATNDVELILCCTYDPAIDLDAWTIRYRDLDLDVPLVIIADDGTEPDVLLGALRAGARDLSQKGDTDHLQLVVTRELADFQHRRNEILLRERLEECEKRSRELVNATGEAVAFIQEGIHVQVNPTYQTLFGFAATDELEGYPLLDLIDSDYHRQVGDILRSVEKQGADAPEKLDVTCIREDGGRFDACLSVSRSQLEGEPCVRVMTETQLPEVERAVPQSVDADTGLPNREALMEELATRVARAGPEDVTFTVVYVGVRIFQVLLQDRGLTGGLTAAARFAALLRDLAPEDAYLARARDDGYVLLIDGLGPTGADELNKLIGKKARLPIDQGQDEDDNPQCSAGVAQVQSADSTPSEVLDAAYRDFVLRMLGPAKRPAAPKAPDEPKGSKQIATASEEERRIAARIQQALDVDGFQLVYQPIVSLKGDRQESYSVLLRLREDDRSLRAAKDFLGTAIKSGTMAAVDRWVIRTAISELAAHRAKGQDINFFVSVAEETLQDEKLLIWICDCLREFQARGSWLTLQVDEQHARNQASEFSRLNEGLRKVSCRVALNRFGEGPNPEVLLRSLHLDYVKFPLELGQQLADEKNKQKRLQELTKLCRDANVKSVVTGVEDARSLTVLWTAGIDYVQGNFLQKPSPAIDQGKKA